jgi:hypothetical protein
MKITLTIEKETFSDKEFSLIAHVQGVLENLFGKKAVKRKIK